MQYATPVFGVGLHAPADSCFEMTVRVDDQRLAALRQAWDAHPERFSSSRLPRKLRLPEQAWINEPVAREKE